MRRTTILGVIGCFASLLTLTTNCDNVHLSLVPVTVAPSVTPTLKGTVCADSPATYHTFTKVMFLVDKSGSNHGNGSTYLVDPANGGTDVDKSFRRGSIQNFLTAHRQQMLDGKLFMGYIAFGAVGDNNNDGAQAYIEDPLLPTNAIFSNDPTLMDASLAKLGTTADNGGTPYHAAITMALDAINADRAKLGPRDTALYAVVLISDGNPTDDAYKGADDLPDITKIYVDVDKLRLAKATLSTVYYGPAADAKASVRLNQMSDRGGGSFLDTNQKGRNVPLDNIIGYSFAETYQIRSFVVSNLNASPCDDGTMGIDTDADGICDKDELSYNTSFTGDRLARMGGKKFDPYNRNSFGKNYNDLIYHEFIAKGTVLDDSCTMTGDEDKDLLNNCEEAFIKISNASTAAGPTADWTSRMKMDADPLNFDSDGDGFTDWMEFVFERSAAAALNYNSITREIDGFRMDQIMLKHLHPNNPKGSIAYDGKFLHSELNKDSQNCYTYQQDVLPTYASHKVTADQVSGYADLAHEADENVVLIYYIQNPQSDPNGAGEMRYMFQKVKVGQKLNVDFDNLKFQSYDASGSARVVPSVQQ